MQTMDIINKQDLSFSKNEDWSSRQLTVLKFIWKPESLMFCCVLSCRFSWFSLRVIYTILSLTGTLFMTCLCVVRFFKYGCTFEETRKSCLFNLYNKSENFSWSNNIFKKKKLKLKKYSTKTAPSSGKCCS